MERILKFELLDSQMEALRPFKTANGQLRRLNTNIALLYTPKKLPIKEFPLPTRAHVPPDDRPASVTAMKRTLFGYNQITDVVHTGILCGLCANTIRGIHYLVQIHTLPLNLRYIQKMFRYARASPERFNYVVLIDMLLEPVTDV